MGKVAVHCCVSVCLSVMLVCGSQAWLNKLLSMCGRESVLRGVSLSASETAKMGYNLSSSFFEKG